MIRKINNHGFHLNEILIALVIVSITTHWMIVNYQPLQASTWRQRAENDLFTLALAMEDYALTHQTYRGATFKDLQQSAQSSKGRYRLDILNTTDTDFSLTATPQKLQAEFDKQCGVLSLTQTGIKHAAGPAGWKKCW